MVGRLLIPAFTATGWSPEAPGAHLSTRAGAFSTDQCPPPALDLPNRISISCGIMKAVSRLLVPIVVLTAIPPLGWMLWLIYLRIVYGLPDLAGLAGMTGAFAGYFLFIGVSFAKLMWTARRHLPLHATLMTVCALGLVALLSYDRMTFEASGIYEGFTPLYRFGFALGIPFGLSSAVLLWYGEREMKEASNVA